MGCRSGSIWTSGHISVRRFAVRSLISWWRMDGKPPLGQDRDCSIENLAPQPHVAGQFVAANCIWEQGRLGRPHSSMGSAVSQEEAPRLSKLHCSFEGVGKVFQILCGFCSLFTCLWFAYFLLAFSCNTKLALSVKLNYFFVVRQLECFKAFCSRATASGYRI